jgi:hypothetical protein
MDEGMALARSGLLQARAREVAAQREVRVQRAQSLIRDGRQLGREQARAFRERRERRVGFDGLEDYLRQRYVVQRVRIEDLASELGASVSAVRGDLDRSGITVARGAPRRRGRLLAFARAEAAGDRVALPGHRAQPAQPRRGSSRKC